MFALQGIVAAIALFAVQGVTLRIGDGRPGDPGTPPSKDAVTFRRYASVSTANGSELVESLCAFVVPRGGQMVRVELGSIEEIERRVEAWRAAIGAPLGAATVPGMGEEPPTELAAGQALREALLDPIFAVFGEAMSELLVTPDDVVHLVPLDALPNAAEGCVGDRVRITLFHSGQRAIGGRVAGTRLEISSSTRADEPLLLAVGDPAQGADATPSVLRGPAVASDAQIAIFRPLPGAARELAAIGQTFERAFGKTGVVLIGDAATEAQVLAQAPAARYLHFATHGWFEPETAPPRGGIAAMALCGLALAGAELVPDARGRLPGLLTAEELSALDLRHCELAVLAASESNVGSRRAGQGIESLQKALHTAGARAAITSAWKVDDAATCALMERFYAHLWVGRLSVGDALWRAKAELRALGLPARDWAAWVVSQKAD